MSCMLECRATALSQNTKVQGIHAFGIFMICRMKENWEKHFVVDVDIVTM